MTPPPTAQETLQLTFGEKLDCAIKVGGGVTAALGALVCYPFLSKSNKHPVLFQHVVYTLARNLTSNFTIRQMRATGATTEAVYNALAAKHNFAPNTVTIDEDGTKAYWLGDTTAKKVLLWLHSGGYCCHQAPQELDICWHYHQISEGKLAVLVLDYDLAPEHPYPRQLSQAARALQYLLSNGRSPSEIIIGGGSAGGHLCLALLGHLSHPHPNPTVPAITLPAPLDGFLLISPGVSLDGREPPAPALDSISSVGTGKWGAAYRGGVDFDPYNSPVSANAEWWKNPKAKNILFVAGADEILATNIKETSDKMKSVYPETETLFAVGESHMAAVFGAIIGTKEQSESAIFVDSWLKRII
ncbi:Alpha/Beta hydrolase protein [Xylogone sp. PMI_703]|nr:Alpha/Beta hydrolase protein [Xylogone sp. PMI_703]